MIETVKSIHQSNFQNEVNELIEKGYKVISASTNTEADGSLNDGILIETFWCAILEKENQS